MRSKFKFNYILYVIFILSTGTILANFLFVFDINQYVLYGLIFLSSGTLVHTINMIINHRKNKQLLWLENRVKLWDDITYRVNVAGEEAFSQMPVAMILFNENYEIQWANKYAKNVFMSPLVDKGIQFINQDLLVNLQLKHEKFDIK